MFILLLPVLAGLTFNTLNDHPHTYADVKASLVKQATHPVVVANYTNLNK